MDTLGAPTHATILLASLLAAAASAEEAATAPLFRIERSKNANIVQYDARLSPAGNLDPEEPVVAYWIRRAEDGRRRELKWIERKLAYGFKAHYDAATDTATLDLVADIRRQVRVSARNGAYRAVTPIAGRPAFLEKLFIESDESGTLPKVVHIDFSGTDVETGEERYERFDP
jgi:hypothetical protein